VREVGAAGFRSIWSTQTDGLDALTAMTVAASEVADISLVSAVLAIYTRHPMTLAPQAVSAQSAAGGRLTPGVGRLQRVVIEDRYGIPFNEPVRHMRDYLDVLLPLVRTGAVSHTGKYWSYDGQLNVEDASPFPVVIAAMAPKMLALAGSMCDGTIVTQTG